MIEPKGTNIDKSFTVSGVKDIGNYKYVLLIDFGDLALIKRIKSDNSEIKYHCINETGENIDQFWADPESHTSHTPGYVWINECRRV